MTTFCYEKLENPKYFAEGRLPAHSDHIVCRNMEEAWEGKSSYRMSLNGLWKFFYSKNLMQLPNDFEKKDVDCHNWDEITVPAHLQMEGYGVPQYVNTQYPWDGCEELTPPEIPKENHPVGNYVKYFSLPEGFLKKGIYIRFDGVESAFALWCNGNYVGYSSDSFDAKEFDLTAFVSDGENKLAMQVFKYNSGSWMEDQDMFRFSGIFRDVTLFTRTAMDLYDIKAVTELSDDMQHAELKVDLKGCGKGKMQLALVREKWNLAAGKMERCGEVCALTEAVWNDAADAGTAAEKDSFPDGVGFADKTRCLSEKKANVVMKLANPALWSAEEPNLYALLITLFDEKGKEAGIVRQEIGFRKFELRADHIMYLNGKRIVFNGTDRHEFSSRRGRAIRKEEMETDVRNMKRANINALRMSHYPNNSYMYTLCDRYGLYVIDETNLETHGTWESYERGVSDISYVVPRDNMDWQAMLLDRGVSMLERDKNHASVLIWSCGNEAFGGKVIHELSCYFHKADPTRLVHYEGLCHDRRFNDTSDMESRMYPPVIEIKDYLAEHREKPFICCEYTHAMGNSCGAMDKYTKLTEEEPLYQGGFIWDYIDQSIIKKDRYGEEFQAYGGDFGDRPADYDFCGNGIAFGGDDRKPSPKMQSVKYNYQPLSITVREDTDSVTIRNRSLFTGTDTYTMRMEVSYYGKVRYMQERSVFVAPGKEETFSLGLDDLIAGGEICTAKGEYVVRVSFCLKEKTIYADAGYEVAFGEDVFSLIPVQEIETYLEDDLEAEGLEEDNPLADFVPAGVFTSEENVTLYQVKPYQVIHGKNGLGVKGENFEVLFSNLAGALTSYRYGGTELLTTPLKPNFWRAPTQNDIGNGMPQHYGQWKLASMYLMPKVDLYTKYDHFLGGIPMKTAEYADHVTVTFTYKMPTIPASECFLIYEVYGDGTVRTTLTYEPVAELKDMPEFGIMFKMDADYHNLKWYGYGPEETYMDRMNGAKLSLYEGTAEKELAPYLLPQESGNHAGVRLSSVTNDRGQGLLLAAEDAEGMSFSALPWTPHEIENAAHHFELPKVHYTVVRASLGQLGIAGDNTWGAFTHPEYRLQTDQKMQFTFAFRGI